MYRVFDKDRDGAIPRSELRMIFAALPERLSEEEIEEMLEAADTDGECADADQTPLYIYWDMYYLFWDGSFTLHWDRSLNLGIIFPQFTPLYGRNEKICYQTPFAIFSFIIGNGKIEYKEFKNMMGHGLLR